MGKVFGFEGENNQTLEWMPLDVRRKSDLAGVRVSLAEWQALPIATRRALVEAEVDGADGVEPFVAAVTAALPSVARIAPLARPWATEAARKAVEQRALALGLRAAGLVWDELDDAARYALHRLSDPSKNPDKLAAALAELGAA